MVSGRGQAEREFKVEVETIGRVRHKNLVRLLGYCVEGAYRYIAVMHMFSVLVFLVASVAESDGFFFCFE